MIQAETAVSQDAAQGRAGSVRLLIGTTGRGSKGLYVSHYSNGQLTEPTLIVETANPSFLATPGPSYPFLFAVTQPENLMSHASSFTHPSAASSQAEPFRRISDAPSEAIGGCFVSVNRAGNCVFIANYRGASVASFRADEHGQLTLSSHINFPPTGHGPVADRQQQSYCHSALPSPDGDYVLVNDLGLDCIHIFRLDHTTAKLTAHGKWDAAPGSGPRHLAFHPNGRWIYCIHELNSTIALLDWDKSAGSLTTIGTPVSTLQPGVSADGKRACEMVLSRDLRFLYASTRVDELFTVYTIQPDTGALTELQYLPNPGK